MKVLNTILGLIFLSTIAFGQGLQESDMEVFLQKHLAKVQPLQKQAALAYWNAALKGQSEDYETYSKVELELKQVYSDPKDFELIKAFKESGNIKDPLLARQLEVLYLGYLQNQIEPELLEAIVQKGAKIEERFNTFRGKIDGKPVSGNDIELILKEETDSAKRKDAWLASKQVAPEIANDLIELVKLRNKAAHNLGFKNYHTLSLSVDEQSVEELDAIFDELYKLTNEPFAKLKNELDGILAKNSGVSVDELKPWHYHDPFFQETPLVYQLDLDGFYENKDVVKLAEKFYASINMPVEGILANSDLYEKEGKNPHAFCTDIDRKGDVRILCNVKNNERWMETMLHELGHGVYDKYQDSETPYLLRTPAHTFTTEAIAMFFGRLSRNGAWMQEMLDLSDGQRSDIDKVSDKYARLKQLIFARWAMVMYNFEKELYADPEQDLNTLWWDLVEKYQMVKRPEKRNEPDWAAKIHFSMAPCYYHNYLLGELFASQLHHTLLVDVMGKDMKSDVSYIGAGKAGEYIEKHIFEPGAKYRWNEMIENATGEPLTARFFVEQFVK